MDFNPEILVTPLGLETLAFWRYQSLTLSYNPCFALPREAEFHKTSLLFSIERFSHFSVGVQISHLLSIFGFEISFQHAAFTIWKNHCCVNGIVHKIICGLGLAKKNRKVARPFPSAKNEQPLANLSLSIKTWASPNLTFFYCLDARVKRVSCVSPDVRARPCLGECRLVPCPRSVKPQRSRAYTLVSL